VGSHIGFILIVDQVTKGGWDSWMTTVIEHAAGHYEVQKTSSGDLQLVPRVRRSGVPIMQP
jgi:hypothetical protein